MKDQEQILTFEAFTPPLLMSMHTSMYPASSQEYQVALSKQNVYA